MTEENLPARKKFEIPQIFFDCIEGLLLFSRYLLVLSSVVLVTFGVADVTIGFLQVVADWGLSKEELLDKVMKWLHLLDVTMAINLFWFIPAGGYYVFIHPKANGESRFNKPRILNHISSGLLKEKMVGSMVAIASVVILQQFLNVATQRVPINLTHIAVEVGLFLTLLVCLLVFNHTNKADHHPHNAQRLLPGEH